mgnify:CR=1 FL=1
MIVFIIVSPIAIGFANEIIQYTILRFREFGHRISVNEDRHVLLVYEAIYVWLSEIKTRCKVVAYGINNIGRKDLLCDSKVIELSDIWNLKNKKSHDVLNFIPINKCKHWK